MIGNNNSSNYTLQPLQLRLKVFKCTTYPNVETDELQQQKTAQETEATIHSVGDIVLAHFGLLNTN